MTRGREFLRKMILCLAPVAICSATNCGGGSPGGGRPPSPTITSVSVTCFATVLQAGQTDQCSAAVSGTGSFSTSVIWTASSGEISATGVLTAPGTPGQVTITATSVADSTKSGTASVTANPQQKSGFEFEGLTHVSWAPNEYTTPAGTTSRDALAATGATWAGLLVTWYQASATAITIAPNPNSTPTDAALVAAIQEFHDKGVKVMLKPHVDGSDGSWRGTFQPTDVDAWFQSFMAFSEHYATLAQDNNVEMLCFGTEFVDLSGAANRDRWLAAIAAIRAIYTGPLAYAANAPYAGDEFTSVSFWDEVDVIGLDAYFPLTDHNDPTLAQLVAAWNSNRYGENIVADVMNFAGAHPGKPVIFTEIGYRSAAGTNSRPYDWNLSAPADNIEQQNCYEALYEVWSPQSSEMRGNFYWAWSVPVPAPGDTDYTRWQKPAQTILQGWQ
jgi:Glycoside Hydrolase Family 113